MDREKTLALLDDTHVFPGPFTLRVIVKPGGQASVVTAISAWCAEGCAVEHVDERASTGGNWIAVHVRVRVNGAGDVLAMYEVISQIDAVVMTL